MTIHGFRAMFSTILNENEKELEWGFDGDIVEAQLAHKGQNAIGDACNPPSSLDKRCEMLQKWATYPDSLSHKEGHNYKRCSWRIQSRETAVSSPQYHVVFIE